MDVWQAPGATVVIADRRLYPVIKAALPQLTSVRHIVLTNPRQYSPRPLHPEQSGK